MTTPFVTKRSERNELLMNIKKNTMFHGFVVRYIEQILNDARSNYEDTSPASEHLRGQLVAIKQIYKDLTTQ